MCDCRAEKSPARHGDVAAEDGHEDRGYCQWEQGSYTAHHYERFESLSLSNNTESEAEGWRITMNGGPTLFSENECFGACMPDTSRRHDTMFGLHIYRIPGMINANNITKNF